MNEAMTRATDDAAAILARHWREARWVRRFDARRFDGLAKLVASVERQAPALEQHRWDREQFVQWAHEQWLRQRAPRAA